MTPMIRVLRDQRGYSLVELLIVCAVLGMILAGIFVIQQQGQQAYLLGSHRVEVQQNNRVTLDMMVRELRSALSIVTLGSATDLTFTTCTDLTATSPCPPAAIATVRYQLSGTTLNRTEGGVTTPLVGGVQMLAMSYADRSGTATTVPSKVVLIRLQLTTQTEDSVSAGSFSNQHATMESTVRLRNM